MDYKEKVIALLNSQELSKEQKEKLEEMFHELKESEDERIRLKLIEAVKGDMIVGGTKDKQLAIAWLEKQGEQKPNPVLDIEIPFGAKDSELQEASYYIPEGFHAEIESNRVVIKRGEQKPKFRVGDTIRCKYDDRQFTIKSVDLDKGTYIYTQEGCGNDIDYADEEFELVEQKPAWSEEDENYHRICLDLCTGMPNGGVYAPYIKEEAINWLKSLKGRVQPQPKKDWNKNDELNRQDTIRLLTDAKERYLQTDASIPKCIKWLENLSLQNTWKPSEEQMDAIKDAIDYLGCNTKKVREYLMSLYEQLKKLRGE